jgi:hypothetical protein
MQVCDGNGRAPTQAVIEKLLDLVQLPAVNWEAPQPLEGMFSSLLTQLIRSSWYALY